MKKILALIFLTCCLILIGCSAHTKTLFSSERLTVVDYVYVDDGYMYADGTIAMWIDDTDWDLTFDDGSVYREERDEQPMIGDVYLKNVYLYEWVDQKNQVVKSKYKTKFEFAPDITVGVDK